MFLECDKMSHVTICRTLGVANLGVANCGEG